MPTKLNLQEEVIEELAFDPQVRDDDIAVSVKEGVVTLRGSVPSFYQRWEAEDAVKRVRGIRGIADELKVDLPVTHVRTDTDIALAIEHRFDSNSSIPSDVKFIVKEGHVTLSGAVPWNYQSTEAAREAACVTGVTHVDNFIRVAPLATTLTSDQIKQKIHSELQRMADLDANHITVRVSDGTVSLSGSVRSWLERDKAVNAAWSLPGVSAVQNDIRIAPLT